MRNHGNQAQQLLQLEEAPIESLSSNPESGEFNPAVSGISSEVSVPWVSVAECENPLGYRLDPVRRLRAQVLQDGGHQERGETLQIQEVR